MHFVVCLDIEKFSHCSLKCFIVVIHQKVLMRQEKKGIERSPSHKCLYEALHMNMQTMLHVIQKKFDEFYWITLLCSLLLFRVQNKKGEINWIDWKGHHLYPSMYYNLIFCIKHFLNVGAEVSIMWFEKKAVHTKASITNCWQLNIGGMHWNVFLNALQQVHIVYFNSNQKVHSKALKKYLKKYIYNESLSHFVNITM